MYSQDDLGRAVELRPKAVQALQQIALAFLDSAFNCQLLGRTVA